MSERYDEWMERYMADMRAVEQQIREQTAAIELARSLRWYEATWKPALWGGGFNAVMNGTFYAIGFSPIHLGLAVAFSGWFVSGLIGLRGYRAKKRIIELGHLTGA